MEKAAAKLQRLFFIAIFLFCFGIKGYFRAVEEQTEHSRSNRRAHHGIYVAHVDIFFFDRETL